MIQELVYTSLEKGLLPGARGFSTVAMTLGMPAQARQLLESLSGYSHLYTRHDETYAKNPVAWSHLLTPQGDSILSRVAACEFDYTGRTNKLAHHVLFSGEKSLPPCGPAEILKTRAAAMTQKWTADARYLESDRMRAVIGAGAPEPNATANSWKTETKVGVRGAAVLAQYLRNGLSGGRASGAPAYIVFDPDCRSDLPLKLVAEVCALLSPPERWRVTFSTYFTGGLPPDMRCDVRFCLRDEPTFMRQRDRTLWVDLTTGDCHNADFDCQEFLNTAETGIRAQAPGSQRKSITAADITVNVPSNVPKLLNKTATNKRAGVSAQERGWVRSARSADMYSEDRDRLMLLGLLFLVLLALVGAGYFLFSDNKGAAEEDNLSDDPTEVKSLTKPKTNAAPAVAVPVASSKTSTAVNIESNAAAKVVKAEPIVGDKGTNQLAEAQAKKPETIPEKPISSYEYLADFSPDKVPESVATEDEATNNTWRVYCLKVSSAGALKVEKGDYVPGYKKAKGNINSKIKVGDQKNEKWKNDYKWVLFENQKLGTGFLYQVHNPGDDKKAIRIDIPFKCGEHAVDGSKLEALCPVMLKAFNQAGCIEVWVRIGEGADLLNTNKIRVVSTQVEMAGNKLKVKYGDTEIGAFLGKRTSFQSEPLKSYDLLRDKIGEIEKSVDAERKELKAQEDKLATLNEGRRYIENTPARLKAEIAEMDARIKTDEKEIERIRKGKEDKDTDKKMKENDDDIKWCRQQKFDLNKALEKGIKDMLNDKTKEILEKKGEVKRIETALNALSDQLKQQKTAFADTLAGLKNGKLPMTATVILDAPDPGTAKAKDAK